MEMLHDSGLVGSLDIVELNPFLDERGESARLLVDLTASLMGRQIMSRPATQTPISACRARRMPRLGPSEPTTGRMTQFISVAEMTKLVRNIGIERFSTELAGYHPRGFPALAASSTRGRASPAIRRAA